MVEAGKIINTDYMVIDEAPKGEDYRDSNKYIKLSSDSASRISALLKGMYDTSVANSLSGAYRVVFPEGLAGVLTPHGDGFLAIMRDPVTKKYMAQGTLYSLQEAGMMYNVFSIMSMATGQYFMRQINDNLRDIQVRMDQILDFLYTDKSCEISAEAKMVFGIYRNSVSIMHSPEQRTASIQTIYRAKSLAERNIQFYYRDMQKLASRHDSLSNLENDLNNYTQAVSLYGVCAVLEIVLSENYDEAYMKYIEDDLKQHVNKHHQEVGQLRGMIMNMPKPSVPAPFLPGPKEDPKRQKLLDHIDKLLSDESPVKGYTEIISQMRTQYNNKSEYRITPDGSVFQAVS